VAEGSPAEAYTSRVEARAFRVELRASLAEVHTSRHLRHVRRQCFGRMPLQEQAAKSSVGRVGPRLRPVRRYQRDHGLDVTGNITDPVLQALGLG
jgi:hypothetical protein